MQYHAQDLEQNKSYFLIDSEKVYVQNVTKIKKIKILEIIPILLVKSCVFSCFYVFLKISKIFFVSDRVFSTKCVTFLRKNIMFSQKNKNIIDFVLN